MKSKLNKDIASQFNESPCDILKSSSDRDAYYISTSFIPTLRIKQWKPVDQSKVADSSMAYCYLEQDDPVVNYNCTKDTFGAKPFVSRVFQDNQQEITRPIATDKCVIEIDPSKIEPGALNDFWHKMETNQCKNMVDKYADSNNALEGDISRLTDELIPLNKTYNVNVATISTRRGTLGGLRTDIYELDREIRELKTASNDLAEMRTIYRQTLADKTASCSSTAAQLLEYNNTCTVNLTYWTGQYNTASTTYATKKPIYEKQQVKYNTNKMALSNIMQQYTNLVENKKQLDINYVVENNNNIKCQDDKTRCLAAYAACSKDDAASITQGQTNNRNWQSCLGTLAICNTNSKSCAADLEQLDKKNTDAVLSYQKCQNALETCNDQLATDKTTRDGVQTQITVWRNTHTNCSPYPPIIDGLKTAIQDILAWCRFPMESALQNQQAYNDALALGVQSTASQVAACEAGQSTLPGAAKAKKAEEEKVYWHHTYSFRWTTGDDQEGRAICEGISSTSEADAKQVIEASLTHAHPPWSGEWRGIVFLSPPTTTKNSNENYEFHPELTMTPLSGEQNGVIYNMQGWPAPDGSFGSRIWLARAGGVQGNFNKRNFGRE